MVNCLGCNFIFIFHNFYFSFFFFLQSEKWKWFWSENNQGHSLRQKRTLTLCSTQTTMSARIKQPTGKKLNNGVKEGGVAGDKENKIIHFHHWEKLKQILNMQFQCYNFLIKLDQSRGKIFPLKKHLFHIQMEIM